MKGDINQINFKKIDFAYNLHVNSEKHISEI